MSGLSLVHIFAALAAMIIGTVIFAVRKGDRRHVVLGWMYVVLMVTGLVAILLAAGRSARPFHWYALIVTCGVIAAVAISRLRARYPGWRSWHGALMSFSMLSGVVAVGGVIGGLALGLGSGPEYYRMFNVVILVVTGTGLGLLLTRPVIWGRTANGRDNSSRARFALGAVAVSVSLIASQWLLLT